MSKEKTLIYIPILMITTLLVYCWYTIITCNIIPEWQHYVGLLLFIPLVYLFFKNIRLCILSVGVFLLIATFNGLGFTPTINTFWLRIGPLQTPHVQLLSMFIFITYFILNLNTLTEMLLDYQEKKKQVKV
jgi:hypothetical protein